MFNVSVGANNTQVLPILAKVLPFLVYALIPWKTINLDKIALIIMQRLAWIPIYPAV